MERNCRKESAKGSGKRRKEPLLPGHPADLFLMSFEEAQKRVGKSLDPKDLLVIDIRSLAWVGSLLASNTTLPKS